MSKDRLDLFAQQASLVIRYEGDLPGLQPAFKSLILPKDLRVVGDALVLTAAGVRSRCCLAPHKAIPHGSVAC